MGLAAWSSCDARHACVRSTAASPVAALALVALLSGCGGSYTRADFVSRADAICLGTVRQLRSVASVAITTTGGEQASATYLERAAPIVRSEAKQIAALPRPAEGKRAAAELIAYVAALRDVAAGFRSLARAERSGDDAAFAQAIERLRANPVASLAQRYGLRYCGTPKATIT
jgi:hypothetical protein